MNMHSLRLAATFLRVMDVVYHLVLAVSSDPNPLVLSARGYGAGLAFTLASGEALTYEVESPSMNWPFDVSLRWGKW